MVSSRLLNPMLNGNKSSFAEFYNLNYIVNEILTPMHHN